MQAFDAELRNRITKLVKGILAQNSLTADVTPSTKLVDAGLTSMDMVNLMLGVEAEFDFTIPQAEITPENFQSVETLERMVAIQLQPATGASRWRRRRLGGACMRSASNEAESFDISSVAMGTQQR